MREKEYRSAIAHSSYFDGIVTKEVSVELWAVNGFVGLTRRYQARLQLELWCLAKAAVASRQAQLRVELNRWEL